MFPQSDAIAYIFLGCSSCLSWFSRELPVYPFVFISQCLQPFRFLLWEPYPSHHNGLFSPLLVLEILLPRGRSISVLSKQYETSYLFYVTLSFLRNIIYYLISVFVFSLVTLSGATTVSYN